VEGGLERELVGVLMGVARVQEAVPGEAAPCRHADPGGGVVGVDLEHLAGMQVSHCLGDERGQIDARQAGCLEGVMWRGHGLTAQNVRPSTRRSRDRVSPAAAVKVSVPEPAATGTNPERALTADVNGVDEVCMGVLRE
jgi:hypothetical protein